MQQVIFDSGWIAAIVLAAIAPAQQLPQRAPLAILPAEVELLSPPWLDANGVPQQRGPEIVFDAGATRYAFAAWRDGRAVGFADGLFTDGFEWVEPLPLGPAGTPVRFRAGDHNGKKAEKWWLLVDGKRVDPVDRLGEVALSSDFSRAAYWTQPGARRGDDGAWSRGDFRLETGFRAGAKWDDADALLAPVFTSDGSKIAAPAARGDAWWIVVASRSGEETLGEDWARIFEVAWRPDGRAIAVAGQPGDLRHPRVPRNDPRLHLWPSEQPQGIFVLEEKRDARRLGAEDFGRYGEETNVGDPVFAPDGKHVAWKYLEKDGGLGIGCDDRALNQQAFASALGTPFFSPDSRRIAVVAQVGGAKPDPAKATRRGSERAVADGHWKLLIDGMTTPLGAGDPEADRVVDPAFSWDGGRLACAVKRNGRWRICCGELESADFDQVGAPHFVRAGSQLAVVFGARRGREITREVLQVEPRPPK